MGYTIELCLGGKTDRGTFTEVQSMFVIDGYDYDWTDAFTSIQAYRPDIIEYVHEHRTSRGYTGCTMAPYLWFDVDYEDDIDKARNDTVAIYNTLLGMGIEEQRVRVFFSGSKGFHIIVSSPELAAIGYTTETSHIMKGVAMLVSLQAGVRFNAIGNEPGSLDPSVYSTRRIFRIENSRHGSTGLYKVDITDLIVFGSMSAIFERAKNKYKVGWNPNHDKFPPNEKLIEMITRARELKPEKAVVSSILSGGKLIECITGAIPAGSRNTTMASIAGFLHKKRFDREAIKAILTLKNSTLDDPLDESEIEGIASSISQYEHAPEQVLTVGEVHTMAQAAESWYRRITTTGYNSFGPRWPHLNEETAMMMPGDIFSIVGTSGFGKSTLGMLLGNGVANALNEFTMMASLEMSDEGLFFRAGTIELVPGSGERMPPREIAKKLIDSEKLRDGIAEEWSRFLICSSVTSLEQIEVAFRKTREALAAQGKTLGTLVIDYGQMLDGTENNDKEKTLARGLKGWAKRLGAKVILLLQLNKSYVDPTHEPMRHHIEGSGGWFQSSDYMLAGWASKADATRLHAKMLKTRFGAEGSRFDIARNGLKFKTIDEVPEPAEEKKQPLTLNQAMKDRSTFCL